MALRSFRERALQACAYECGGLLVAAPLYAVLFDASATESVVLTLALSVAVTLWAPLHNWAFDAVEWRRARRVASDRPHRWRVAHALSLEASSTLVTVPLVMVVGGHGFWTALVVDLGFTAVYVAYSYLFHLAYDRLRPVSRTHGATE